MLLMMLERNMLIDEIIFCDTGKEFPQMYKHLDKVERYTGRKITRLKAKRSFDYYMFDYTKTKGKGIGQIGYGWATAKMRWCTGLLKAQLSARHLRKYGKEKAVYIAA